VTKLIHITNRVIYEWVLSLIWHDLFTRHCTVWCSLEMQICVNYCAWHDSFVHDMPHLYRTRLMNTLHDFAVCCSVLSVLQCVAVCCRVLQCVAVCCSVLQCVAAWHDLFTQHCTMWRLLEMQICVNYCAWHASYRCDMPHSYRTRLIHTLTRNIHVTWLIHVWHDLFSQCCTMRRRVELRTCVKCSSRIAQPKWRYVCMQKCLDISTHIHVYI